MEGLGHNRLGELAALIREAHADTRSAAQRAAERALEAGRHLLEAKATLKHGQWSGWLKDSVGFSERTAQRYMQLAKSGMESATVADLGIRGAAESLARSTVFDGTIEELADIIEQGSKIRAIEGDEPGWLEKAVARLADELSPDMKGELLAAINAHPSIASEPSRFRLDADDPATREALRLFFESMKAQQ